jgi:hypothetical protein
MLFLSRLNKRNQGHSSTPTGRMRSSAARSRLALERLEDRSLPSGFAGFQADGVGANDHTGYSTAVGDVNGDGIADMIIGAWGANSSAGKVYVVFGNRSGFPSPLPLSSLNGTNGFELDDGVAGDRAGFSVAAGDVNGDGIADILIGAPAANSGAGKVDVVFGKTGGWSGTPTTLNATFLNGTNGAEFDGPGNYSSLGNNSSSLAVGDVNGDGICDLIMGAFHVAGNSGAVYVVFGKGGAWSGTATTLNATYLNGINGAEFDGPAGASRTGWSVAAGDVNHDGTADILIGAPGANYTVQKSSVTTGAVFVVFGKGGAWSGTATTLNATFLNGINGVEFDGTTNSQTGSSVAAGDLNGDHIADLVIGAPTANAGAGSVYVVFGASHLLPQTTVSTTTRSYTATVASATGLAVGDTVSSATIPAGTTITAINGTTIALSNKATATGSAPLYVSKVTLDEGFLNGTIGAEFDGPPLGATGSANYTGSSVAVGDVNGDGISDLVIGAYGVNANSGAVFVVFGKGGAWSGTASTLNATFVNGTNGIELDGANGEDAGWSVAVGDVNGDGIADILIGAPGTTINGVTTGAVYVYFGKNSGWTTPGSLDGL